MRASIKTLAFGLVFVLLTSAVPRYALAQEAQPGDACTGGQTNLSRWTGGPETSGTGNLLVCNGSSWQPILRYSSTGLLGVRSAITSTVTLSLGGTDALLLTRGTTAQRPGTPVNGMIRYNSQTAKFEGYQAGAWVDMIGGAGSIDSLSDGVTDYATDFNLFMGSNAGANIVVGAANNLVIGQNAFDAPSKTNAADDNVGVGRNVFTDLTQGNANTAVGAFALDSLTTGQFNVAIGDGTLTALTTGSQNTVIGSGAGNYNNSSNTLVGYGTGTYIDGDWNTAIGAQSFAYNWQGAAASGIYNVAVGTLSMQNLQAGSENVALGHQSLQVITNGNQNVAVGTYALDANTSGNNNTSVGFNSLSTVSTGFGNAAVGWRALNAVTGNGNVAVGADAGSNITSGSGNIIFGSSNLALSATGSNQLDIGDTIYGDLSTDNVRIGGSGAVSAFSNLEVFGTLALMLPSGTDAQRPGTASNGMVRYNTTSNKFEGRENGAWVNMIGGGSGSPAGSSTQVQFNSGGAFGASGNFVWNNGTAKLTITGDIDYTGLLTDTSDRRLKEDITPLSDRGSVVERLSSVGTYSFSMKDDPNKRREYGVMAQELQPAFPELVRVNDDEMKSMSVNYIGLVPVLIEAVKEQQKQIDEQQKRIDGLEAKVEALRAGR